MAGDTDAQLITVTQRIFCSLISINSLRIPGITLALLVQLASEAVVCRPADEALLVQGRDDPVRLLLYEGNAFSVIGE